MNQMFSYVNLIKKSALVYDFNVIRVPAKPWGQFAPQIVIDLEAQPILSKYLVLLYTACPPYFSDFPPPLLNIFYVSVKS